MTRETVGSEGLRARGALVNFDVSPYDTNIALFPSFTLSMHMYAKTLRVKHYDYDWRVYAGIPGQ